ncbi:putative methyltransferase DDB_G0268948 [Tachypleus tridentatus]|uniref:putative methyltransferase DDB_G0268948 n=2 Tax=Tachypleus tridentatus TaxID=6853 RepID=UPI003FD5C9D1
MVSRLFSGAEHAAMYSHFRPSPPEELVSRIISYVKEKVRPPLHHALDVGCGSGQSTRVLTPYFEKVTGIDTSAAQIDEAMKNEKSNKTEYKVAYAENIPLHDESVQLVSASQCAHWLNLDMFFKEVHRLLVPDGVVALYGYLFTEPVAQGKQEVIHSLLWDWLYRDKLCQGYWAPQRVLLDNCFRDIVLPFSDTVRVENLILKRHDLFSNYLGYITTWSGFRELQKQKPELAPQILQEFQSRLLDILQLSGSPDEIELELFTRFFLLMGRKTSEACLGL